MKEFIAIATVSFYNEMDNETASEKIVLSEVENFVDAVERIEKYYSRDLERVDIEIFEGPFLTITDEALLAIAKKAIERKSGARGLRAIMEERLLELMYNIPDKKDVTEIVVDAEVIAGKKEPILIYSEEEKVIGAE